MKKIVSIIILVVMLSLGILFLTGCTLKIETTDTFTPVILGDSDKTIVAYEKDLRQFEDYFKKLDENLGFACVDASVVRK